MSELKYSEKTLNDITNEALNRTMSELKSDIGTVSNGGYVTLNRTMSELKSFKLNYLYFCCHLLIAPCRN